MLNARLLLVVLAAASAAAAQPRVDKPTPEEAPSIMTAEARRRFDEGAAALIKGDFERARVAFMETYALNQSPEVLRNLAIAQIASGHSLAGARQLSEYMRGAHSVAENPAERAYNERTLADLTAKLSRISVRADVPNAEVFVNDERVGRTPLESEFVTPGRTTVTVRSGDQQRSETVTVPPGEISVVQLTLRGAPTAPGSSAAAPPASSSSSSPSPPPIEPPLPEPTHAPGWPLLVGGGLTVAGLATGLAFTLSASAKQSHAESLHPPGGNTLCGVGTPYPAECTQLHQANADVASRRDWATGSWIFAGATGVLTAGYWVFVYRHGAPSAPQVRATAFASPGNAMATVVGTF